MKAYKLIIEYPGSPKLGYTISGTSSEMFSLLPHKFPKLWQEFECEKFGTLYNGTIAYIGDKVWYILDKSTMNPTYRMLSESDFPFSRLYFKTEEEAIKYRDLQITLIVEDGAVIGENIPIYSLLTKADWKESETTSLHLYRRLLVEERPLSDAWKYFKSKEAREEYLKYNKPKYSLNALRSVLSDAFSDEILEEIIKHLNSY